LTGAAPNGGREPLGGGTRGRRDDAVVLAERHVQAGGAATLPRRRGERSDRRFDRLRGAHRIVAALKLRRAHVRLGGGEPLGSAGAIEEARQVFGRRHAHGGVARAQPL
jgi:hypothetical protein